MGKHLFYSWKYIFRHLERLDFHYAAVGVFGKRAVRKSLKAFSAFLDDSDFNAGQRIAHLPHDDVALRKSPVSRSEGEGRIAFDHTIPEEVSHV